MRYCSTGRFVVVFLAVVAATDPAVVVAAYLVAVAATDPAVVVAAYLVAEVAATDLAVVAVVHLAAVVAATDRFAAPYYCPYSLIPFYSLSPCYIYRQKNTPMFVSPSH